MFTSEFVVKNPTGLHARPASQMAKLCKDIPDDIRLICEKGTINPKNVIGILTAGLKKRFSNQNRGRRRQRAGIRCKDHGIPGRLDRLRRKGEMKMEQATFRNLILRDVEAANAEEAIRKVGQRFYDEGFVKDTYIDAVVAREKNYATGLQLADIAVAMPHTDPQHVNRPGVCIAQLKHPVGFEHMGDPDTKVQAEMLFMMAIKNPDEQVELLQKVLGVFQQPEVVAAFRAAKNEDELFEAAQKYIG